MIIVHRCRRCAHPDIFHSVRMCCYTWCRCPVPDYGPPEIIPTWRSPWTLVEDITPPGTVSPDFGRLCGCPACVALYEAQP